MSMDIDTLGQLFEVADIMLLSVGLFLFNLAITGLEVVVDLLTGKSRRWRDSGANALIFIASQLLERTTFGAIAFIALLPFYYFVSPMEIPMNPLSWFLALLFADFSYYWLHRTEHQVRILWAHHSVHHSSQDFNLTVGFRLCILEGLVTWIFLVPMVVVGFNPFQTLVAFILIVQYQGWIHTEYISKLGWFDGIFNSPSAHRVHHGSNEQYLDRNYGGVLLVWDRMFGTYQPEEEKVVYGLTRNIHTNNPIKINFAEYAHLLSDVRQCRNWRDRWRTLFGRLTRPTDYKTE